MHDKARETALRILNTLHTAKKPLDDILVDVFDEGRQSKLDKAFIYSLVYGVLRWQNRLDWIIKHFSHIKIHKIDPAVLNILRIGLFQIIFLDRVPVSAAVNTSVELSKSIGGTWVVKFVNALLRKASTAYDTVQFPDHEENPVLSLTTAYAFPEWMIKRWIQRFGPSETRQLCIFLNTIPPITVRTNRLKTDRDSLVRLLDQETAGASRTAVSPDGVSFFNPRLPIPQLTSYQRGWFQVQDEAAQLVTLMLNPQPGETVLDACAGLGGKTGHIAQQMKNKGRIIAMDRHKQRLSQLRSEMMHLGVSIVTTNSHDMNLPFDTKRIRIFDRIILDAPCSGLGVLRRNPDAKWVLSKSNLASYQNRQVMFLNTLTPLVKIGGTLVYTVCSIEPEENEDVVMTFLKENPSFSIETDFRDLLPEMSRFIDTRGFFRTYPHTSNMDGFFAVRLKRMR